jgi:hypothetical protein
MASRDRRRYFTATAALMLVLSVVAFSDNLFTDIGQASNRDPKMVVHGLFGLAWYVLLLVQANLVRVRNLPLHRKLGAATLVVALGVALSTLYLFVVLWKGWATMAEEVRANRLLLPGYVLFLCLAWWHRARPDWHKRLVFCATFLMLGPVLARCYDPLVVSWMQPLFPAFTARVDETGFLLFFFGGWIAFFASLALHDRRTLGRVHPVTFAGLAWFALAWVVSLAS